MRPKKEISLLVLLLLVSIGLLISGNFKSVPATICRDAAGKPVKCLKILPVKKQGQLPWHFIPKGILHFSI